MEKILLFKIWAIGDTLMTTPFVRQIKKNRPDVEIDYMIWKKSSSVLQNNQYINEIITFDESTFSDKKIFSLLWFFFKILKLRNKYSSVIIFDKHRIFSFFFKLAWFKKRIWFDRAGKEWKHLTDKIYRDASRRETEYNLDLLKLFSIEPDYNDQKYDFNIQASNESIDSTINTLKSTGKKIIWISTWGWNAITNQIHGGNDCRRRSLDNRKSLTENLLSQDYIVLLLWAPSDRILDISNPNFHNLLWKYSISDSIYIISKLDKIICHESWFMHLVWCTQTPMIALAWPTNPHRLYPYKHPWNILWKETKECYDIYGSFDACTGNEINKITVDDVLNVL